MKTIVLNVLSFLFVCASFASPSPNTSFGKLAPVLNGVFGKLSLHRQHNAVSLSWNTLNAEHISGFVIERSYDGNWFETVTDVSVATTGQYKYLDNGIYPGYLYYRIAAVMNDGSIVYSETEMIRIVSRKGW